MIIRWLQKRWIRFLVKDLFNTISDDNILKIVSEKEVYYRKKLLNAEQLGTIKQEAKDFSGSLIWKLIKNEAKYSANLRMYEKGISDEDILAGKLVLYTIEIFDRKLNDISNL